MKTTSLLICIVLACSLLSFSARSQAINQNDSLALVDLYNSTNGSSWLQHHNWLNGPVKTWDGVGVSGDRVVSLILEENNVTGSLPASIGNLTALTTLDLNHNAITGSIPATMGSLSSLQYLQFYDNKLSGSIPAELGNLSSLLYLQLPRNQLSGTIPANLANLANVYFFSLNSNQLTGSIPPELGNLQQVTQFDLYNNQLSGPIPASLGNLTKAYYIDIANNQLTGSIPGEIGNLTQLTDLYMANNQFSGSIPASFGNLRRLNYLRLENNQLSGAIPDSLGNLVHVFYIDLANNQLTGVIPSTFGGLKRLSELDFSYNHLSGEIPTTFRKLDALDRLDFSHNNLTQNTDISFPASSHLKTITLIISYNNYTFNGLESVEKRIPNATYAPQANIAVHQSGNTLSVSAGGNLSHNTYQWFKIGTAGSTSIVGDSTFQPTESGQYFATITNSIATDLTLHADTVTYAAPQSRLTVAIYPNPVKDRLTINGLNAKNNTHITVADLSGIVWINTLAKQQSTVHYDVTTLKPGNYVLHITSGQMTRTLNFIKQ